ncbi:50S ribosomal protein L35ae [Candidatus Woesearchaeota archaeon CG10_big_fil_rev_8_21_14_0_10_34_12]|nr:MAG: 50S ribosomal protein L35ae [Candidatus Woesearchaeota archaeon CG10_big_fil_rev_8_21_14_0_10_34_12]
MKGQVIQFRRGRKTYTPRHFILDAGTSSRKEAEQLIGKEVEWKNPRSKKVITGKITSPHGNRGLIRAVFEKGLPGQAVNDEIEVKAEISKVKKSKAKTKSVMEKK